MGIQISHDQFEDVYIGKVIEALQQVGKKKKERKTVKTTINTESSSRKRSDNDEVKYF